MLADGRILQAHSRLEELGALRHLDIFQSQLSPAEIGIDVHEVAVLKRRVDEVRATCIRCQTTCKGQQHSDSKQKLCFAHSKCLCNNHRLHLLPWGQHCYKVFCESAKWVVQSGSGLPDSVRGSEHLA